MTNCKPTSPDVNGLRRRRRAVLNADAFEYIRITHTLLRKNDTGRGFYCAFGVIPDAESGAAVLDALGIREAFDTLEHVGVLKDNAVTDGITRAGTNDNSLFADIVTTLRGCRSVGYSSVTACRVKGCADPVFYVSWCDEPEESAAIFEQRRREACECHHRVLSLTKALEQTDVRITPASALFPLLADVGVIRYVASVLL